MANNSQTKEFATDLKQSAHKIWLAGLGAVSVAEEEGSRFFKNLVQKGEKFESRRRKDVEKAVERVKDGVEEVKEGVESRWNRLGDSFDRKVGRAIERLGVPSREEIHKLTQRVEDLTRKLESAQPKRSTRKPAARKTARKTARKSA